MNVKKRIKWLDFAKGFAIFFVVMWHAVLFISPYYLPLFMNIISTFIMPIFFAVSGYLYRPVKSTNDYITLIYKKMTSFVIPYIIFTVVIFYFNKYNLLPLWLGEHHYTILQLVFCNPMTYLWFLYALFLIFLIIGSINLIMNNSINKMFIISILILLIALALIWKLMKYQAIGFILCFLIGQFLHEFIDKRRISIIYKHYYILYIILLIWGIIICGQTYISGMYSYNNMFTLINAFTKLLSIPLLFSLFTILRNSKLFRYFNKYGKYTLVIYIVHFPIMILLGDFFKNFNISSWVLLSVLFIITWEICIIICTIINKVKLLHFVFYPRKYFNKLFNI